MFKSCKICNIKRKDKTYNNYNSNICLKCIINNSVYTEYDCVHIFELDKTNLKNLTVYIKDNIKYYKKDDVINLIIVLNNVKDYDAKYIKNINKIMLQKIRRSNLLKYLHDNKITYKRSCISDAYIKYGSPNFEFVINFIEQQQTEQTERYVKLIKLLNKHNITFDEKIPCFNDYINNKLDLDCVLNNYDIEIMIVYTTDYINLLLNYDKYTAREIAFNNLINSDTNNTLINNNMLL